VRLIRSVWLLVLVAAAALLAGCASTGDEESVSERPWNTPRSWEGGLPSGFYEGR
jgi:hypothetical protein